MVARVRDDEPVGVARDVVRPAERVGAEFATVLVALVRVGLPDDHLRLLERSRHAGPAEHASIAGVGHPEAAIDDGDAEGPVHGERTTVPAAVLVDCGGIRLPDDHVGRDVGLGRDGVPDQDAMVPRVGDDQASVVHDDACRQPHARFGSTTSGLGAFGGEVGLAEDDVGVGVRLQGARVTPDQYTVIPGVRSDEHVVVEPHSARGIKLRARGHRIGQPKTTGGGGAEPHRRRCATAEVDRRVGRLGRAPPGRQARGQRDRCTCLDRRLKCHRYGPRHDRRRCVSASVRVVLRAPRCTRRWLLRT